MEYEILVQLKGEVLDPEGRAIQSTLNNQGYQDVTSIKVAKRYVLELSGDSNTSEARANEIAEKYLANPVAQSFTVRRLSR